MPPPPTSRPRPGWKIARLLRPHAAGMTLVVVLLGLLAVANMALPFCIKVLIDDVFPHQAEGRRWDLVWLILGGLAVIYVARNVLFFTTRMLALRIGEEVCFRLRSRLFEHLQQMSFGFYQANQVGRLSSRLMDDTQTILAFIQDRLPTLILNAVMLVVLLGVIYVVNWQLALLSSLVLPLHFLTYRYFISPIKQSHARAQDSLAAAHGSLVERFLGIEVVKSFTAERREIAQFDSTIASAKRSFIRSQKYHFAQKVTGDLLIGVATVGLLGFGAWHVIDGVMSAGAFLMFFGYVMMLYPTVLEVLSGGGHRARAAASVERVNELLERSPTDAGVLETAPDTSAPPIRGDLEFRDVSFSYGDGPAVLQHMSFSVRAGEHVAIAGPSGCGKTTMVSLIARFNEPSSGQVLIDGRDASAWPVAELRKAVGIAFQEVFLFNSSLFENLLYGRYDATVQEIIEACEITGAHEIIEQLPVGYGSMPNELGGRFSRGEKQRITLARAIVKAPRILILDEATASLDPGAGVVVLDRILARMKGRTVIVITHDLTLAALTDRVITLREDGGVAGGGVTPPASAVDDVHGAAPV